MLVLSNEEARGGFANINMPQELAEWKVKGPEKSEKRRYWLAE